MVRASENEYKFPASNSVTEIDAKYFAMIQSEADWGNFTHQLQVSELCNFVANGSASGTDDGVITNCCLSTVYFDFCFN